MTEAATTLQVRRIEPADEAQVLGLLTAALAGGPTGSRSAEFLRWKHQASPFGASPGLVATDGDRIVGVRLFLRWRLAMGDRVLHAVRAVDTATHPDYQRRGIFRTLTLSLLEQLEAEERVDLVFNTPNADSRPGYLRMGWQEVGHLPVLISVVRPLRFLRGARAASGANASGSAAAVAPTAGVEVASCPLPTAREVLADPDTAPLLDRLVPSQRLHTPITPDYLGWRYADAPGLDYRAVVVRDGARVAGLGLGRVRTRAGLTELTLGEVLVAPGDRWAAARVLRAARRSGVDHVAVHAARGTDVAAVALRCGYLTAPGGSGIGLVANPRPGCPPEVLDVDAWDLSLGDLEVF